MYKKLDGMTCHSCERNIAEKMNKIPGVFNCEVSLGNIYSTATPGLG